MFIVEYEECLRKWKEDFYAEFRARKLHAFRVLDQSLISSDNSIAFRAAVYTLDSLKAIEVKEFNMHQQIREASIKKDEWDSEFFARLDWSYLEYDQERYAEYCKTFGIAEQKALSKD